MFLAAVLGGGVFGDHCSPISDTTVLSALGSGVEVVDHVRTQLPYVLTVGVVSVLIGSIPAALGVSLWVVLPLGAVACIVLVTVLGTRPETALARAGSQPQRMP